MFNTFSIIKIYRQNVSIFKKQIRHSLPKTLHKKFAKITKNDLEMLVIFFAKYIKNLEQKKCKNHVKLTAH